MFSVLFTIPFFLTPDLIRDCCQTLTWDFHWTIYKNPEVSIPWDNGQLSVYHFICAFRYGFSHMHHFTSSVWYLFNLLYYYLITQSHKLQHSSHSHSFRWWDQKFPVQGRVKTQSDPGLSTRDPAPCRNWPFFPTHHSLPVHRSLIHAPIQAAQFLLSFSATVLMEIQTHCLDHPYPWAQGF